MSRYDYHQRSLGDRYYRPRPKKKNRLARIFVTLIFFALIIALFIYVFPAVEVTIVPETETVVNDFEIAIDANISQSDLINNKVNGELIIIEDSLEKVFVTTGEKDIGDQATGAIVFYNQTGLVQPLTPGNSLVSDDGLVFHLTANLDIPKAEVSAEGTIIYGNITANIIAEEAGEQSNINPGRLTIVDLPFTKQNKIYGEVKTKLTGGNSKIIKVVSEEDLEQAEEKIVDILEPQLTSDIEQRLGDNRIIHPGLIQFEILSVEKEVELEQEIDEFTLKVKASSRALVWDDNIVKEMVYQKIKNNISPDKELIETSQDIFNVEVVDLDLEDRTAHLKLHTENQISMPIDVNRIKDELKGLSEFEARRLLLNQDNIKDVRFKFSYSITNNIPQNGNRINIKLNFR